MKIKIYTDYISCALFLMNFLVAIFLGALFGNPIDEVAIQNLKSYKEKNFVDIIKEDLYLG